MKQLLLFILFCGLFISTATGQHADREVYPTQVSIDHNDAVKNFSREYISAFSSTSSSFGPQQSAGGPGNLAIVNVRGIENRTVLAQAGYGITGIIDIHGTLNKANLEQKGADLLSVLNMEGNANQFDMTQLGKGLQNYFQIFGSGLNVDAVQTNEGMKLTQSGTGSLPFSIQQSGRPSPIIISNN